MAVTSEKKNFHLYSIWNESVSQKGLLSSELTWWIKEIFSDLNIIRAWRAINGTAHPPLTDPLPFSLAVVIMQVLTRDESDQIDWWSDPILFIAQKHSSPSSDIPVTHWKPILNFHVLNEKVVFDRQAIPGEIYPFIR